MRGKMRHECDPENCNAPLCPLDDQSLQYGVWYPGEAICRHEAMQKVEWIARQRSLTKNDPGAYFTFVLLVKGAKRGITA